MIIVTIEIASTQDDEVTLNIKKDTKGEVTNYEVAHMKAIDAVLKNPLLPALVEVMLLKDDVKRDCDKCQSKEKESEHPESPIREIH